MNQISRDGRLGFSGVPLAASYDQFQADAFRSVFQCMQETGRLIHDLSEPMGFLCLWNESEWSYGYAWYDMM